MKFAQFWYFVQVSKSLVAKSTTAMNANPVIRDNSTISSFFHRGEEMPHVQAVHLSREVEGDARAGRGAVGARTGQGQGAPRRRRLCRRVEFVTFALHLFRH